MATTTCTWGTIYASDTPTKQYDPNWQVLDSIIGAKDDKDGAQNWYSRMSITTGSTSKFYRSSKMVVKVSTYGTFCNAHYNACRAYLSTEEYTKCPDILDVDPNFASAYGPGEGLSGTDTLASSPVCTDTSGTTSTKTTGIANGTTFYFVFNTAKLKSNTTYYFYLIRYTSTYAGYFRATIDSISMDYEQTESLTAPTISTTSSIVSGTASSINVTWNSIANASSYNLTLKVGDTEIGSATGLSSTSHSCSVSNLSNHRGKNVTAYVKAIGSGKYTSSSNTTKTVAKVNSLPTISVTQDGEEVTSSSSVTFTVSGSDTDSQSVDLYYSLNGSQPKIFTSPLTIEKKDLTKTSNSITFYAQDSLLEKSATTDPYLFTAVFAPVLQSGASSAQWNCAESMSGNTTTLTKDGVISFVLTSGTVETIEAYATTGSASSSLNGGKSQINSSAISYTPGQSKFTITINKISESIIAPGDYFKISFVAKDAAGEASDEHTISDVKRRGKKPRVPSSIAIKPDVVYSNLSPYDNYFRNKVVIDASWDSLSSTEKAAYAKLTDVRIINSIDKGTGISCSTSNFTGKEISLTSTSMGATVNLNFKVTDDLGQIISGSSFATLTRAKNISKASGAVEPTTSINLLKPYENKSQLEFAHAIVTSTNSEKVTYSYTLKLATEQTITSGTIEEDGQGTRKLIITADDIKTLAESASSSNKNTIYDETAIFTYVVTDAFGMTYSESVKFTVDFRQNPYFDEDDVFSFRINHDISETKTWSQLTSQEDGEMINTNEQIVFQFTPAKDDNGDSDIVKYVIQLARKDITKSGQNITIPTINETDYTDWITINRSSLSLSDAGFYYYYYRASQYVKNEVFRFKIYAIDSTGLNSTPIVASNSLIGCRTTVPDFTVGDVTVAREQTADNEEKLTLNYAFKITDLGGSSTLNKWNEDYYASFPNFEREITNYTPSAILKIEVAPSQEFNSNQTLVAWAPNISVDKPYTGNLVNFTYNDGTIFTGFSGARVFMRFTLYISYALDSSRTSNPLSGLAVLSTQKVFTYFGSIPTVSHRAHWVGINTNAKADDEAFVVENYQNKQYVVFRGTDPLDAENTYCITFDLLSGAIDGAIIDGGSW